MGIFHRYDSTIHGNYRKGYLRSGAITGILLSAYVLVRLLMGSPTPSPASYVTDAILLVAVFLFTAYYRNALEEKKITLKEAMLFGMGTAVVAAVVYGLALWAVGLAFPQQCVVFAKTMMGKVLTLQDPQLHYWAAWWAIVGAVEVAVLGAFGAFVAAIVFRNEKSQIKHKTS